MEKIIRLFLMTVFLIITINSMALGAESFWDNVGGKQIELKRHKNACVQFSHDNPYLKRTSSQFSKREFEVIHVLIEEWENSDWENHRLHNYTYGDMANLVIFEEQKWNNEEESWDQWYKESYIYDDEGNCLEMLIEIWHTEYNEWIPDTKETYIYEDGKLSVTLVYSWTGDLFELWFRHLYSYEENGNLIETLTEDYMGDNQWEFLARALYTYDEYDRLIEGLYQEWKQYEWVDLIRGLGTYENDENPNPIEWLTQINFNGWINLELETFTYDEGDKLIEFLEQIWEDEDWLNQMNIFYSYDENENLMEEIHKIWTEDEIWEDHLRYTHNYEEITSIEKSDIKNSPHKIYLATNYPNPFNPETTISFEISHTSGVRLAIYDASGKLIKTLIDDKVDPGYHSVIWDGRDEMGKDMASGVYLYRLTSNNFNQTKQMLLVK